MAEKDLLLQRLHLLFVDHTHLQQCGNLLELFDAWQLVSLHLLWLHLLRLRASNFLLRVLLYTSQLFGVKNISNLGLNQKRCVLLPQLLLVVSY
jgi:hypothetical protein